MNIIADLAQVTIWKWRHKHSVDIRVDLILVFSLMHNPLYEI